MEGIHETNFQKSQVNDYASTFIEKWKEIANS